MISIVYSCAIALVAIVPTTAAIFLESKPHGMGKLAAMWKAEKCTCPGPDHKPKPSDSQPNVFAIGDSLYGPSLGGWPYYSKELEDKGVHVARESYCGAGAVGFCGSSYYFVQCGSKLFSSKDWDVVTYNWGLHDQSPDYAVLTIEEHKTNLRQIYTDLKSSLKPETHLIFITSTPVAGSHQGIPNFNKNITAINQALFEVADEFDPPIEVFDMYTKILKACHDKDSKGFPDDGSTCPSIFKPGDVHMTEEGRKLFADVYTKAVLKALK